jgi:energy-coupling factor transporter ATP-binding protein EcfA2
MDTPMAKLTATAEPNLTITTIRFSDGSVVNLDSGDVVLFVGPNNAGKSEALRAIRNKVTNPKYESPVIAELTLDLSGSPEDVEAWLCKIARLDVTSNPSDPVYRAFGSTVHASQIRHYWSNPSQGLAGLGRFFCQLLTAGERLTAADPAPAVALTKDPLTHLIHFVQRDDKLEELLSEQFRRAFAVDLVVHRNAGSRVPLHVGERPIPNVDEDRVSYSYTERLERLPSLETQGDGMRGFAGVLLQVTVGKESILLIDEPEAFLHPPQARILGKMLVDRKPGGRQILVATHSGEVLRGVLDGNAGSVRVVRIRRSANKNYVKELDKGAVRKLWTDPLLRSSNILDGVFHEKVVVCESDGDARFFTAIADALYDGPLASVRRPDVMFTHCGGKARLPMVVRSLKALDVPVVAVADFDILNNEHPLADLVTEAGGDWEGIKACWTSVKNAIDAIRPQLTTEDVKTQIDAVLSSISESNFPQTAKRGIENILKQTSAWALAKKSGKHFVPNGTPMQEYQKLASNLAELRVVLVEVGELERFCPSIGGHGPTWVNEALNRNLVEDPELAVAREFVKGLMNADAE